MGRQTDVTHAHVFVEAGRLAEALPAHVALVWAVLLVHVQDVNAQTIAFLERPATQEQQLHDQVQTRSSQPHQQHHQYEPVAEAARELAIALVDTTRVLQVFVSVVFIREHLPTSLALVSCRA